MASEIAYPYLLLGFGERVSPASRWVGRIFPGAIQRACASIRHFWRAPIQNLITARKGPNFPILGTIWRWFVNGARLRLPLAAIRGRMVGPRSGSGLAKIPHGRRGSHAIQWKLMGSA